MRPRTSDNQTTEPWPYRQREAMARHARLAEQERQLTEKLERVKRELLREFYAVLEMEPETDAERIAGVRKIT